MLSLSACPVFLRFKRISCERCVIVLQNYLSAAGRKFPAINYMTKELKKYAKNRERKAINRAIVQAVREGSTTPVTVAYKRMQAIYAHDLFFCVARTLGYDVEKLDGEWYERTKVE